MYIDERARSAEAVIARHLESGGGSINKFWAPNFVAGTSSELQVECNHCLGVFVVEDCLQRRMVKLPLRLTMRPRTS